MKEQDFEVDDIVYSKVNKIYRGTYIIVKKNKTTCWVKPNAPLYQTSDGPIYKNTKYSILSKV